MAPVPNGMAVNLALDSLLGHLRPNRFQDLVPRSTGLHMLPRHILQPITLFQAIPQPLRDIIRRLSWKQNIRQMLRIGVHSHGCNAKINMQVVSVLNCPLAFHVLRPRRILRYNGHVGLEPSRVIQGLDLLPHPPFYVCRGGFPRRND